MLHLHVTPPVICKEQPVEKAREHNIQYISHLHSLALKTNRWQLSSVYSIGIGGCGLNVTYYCTSTYSEQHSFCLRYTCKETYIKISWKMHLCLRDSVAVPQGSVLGPLPFFVCSIQSEICISGCCFTDSWGMGQNISHNLPVFLNIYDYENAIKIESHF